MKTCTRCRRRLQDSGFRQRTKTAMVPDLEAKIITEIYQVSAGSVCLRCDASRLRFSRGTQTTGDCALEILRLLRPG
jgi:hypothetical protein